MKSTLIICVILSIAAGTLAVSEDDMRFCDLCANHTLCIYEGLGEDCLESSIAGVGEQDKILIVDTHNEFRRKIAKGFRDQPKAANMLKMEWDDDLAKVAQRLADQCQFQHDTCRDDPRFKVGQNLYYRWSSKKDKKINWKPAIGSWFDEIKKFNPRDVDSFQPVPEVGHYTQLVWHNSKFIGCGVRVYGPNTVFVCNYGPAGNYIGLPMYDRGEPCSKCPSNTQCDDGLCAITKNETSSNENIEHDLNSTNYSRILDPPSIDAVDYYNNSQSSDTESSSTINTTELPIYLNLIDELDIPDDAEIRNEIEDLKKRIRMLVEKIALKNLQQS